MARPKGVGQTSPIMGLDWQTANSCPVDLQGLLRLLANRFRAEFGGPAKENPAAVATANGAECQTKTCDAWHEKPAMSIYSPVFLACAELYVRHKTTLDGLEFLRRHGLDWECIARNAGCMVFASVDLLDNGLFDFCQHDGTPAAIIEALDRDCVTIVDLVAWPLDRPGAFASMFGRACMLGLGQVYNPATYYLGAPCRLHRTPLDWLRADGEGACILNKNAAARHLIDAPGPFACDDIAHGREVETLLQRLLANRVLVPSKRRAAA